PLLLLATMAGMALTYLVPPLVAMFGSGAARWIGVGAWALMFVAFQPTLRFYRLSPLWGLALPVIALQYMLFTLDSPHQYVRGRGGSWKGRGQANVSERRRSPPPKRARGKATRAQTFPRPHAAFPPRILRP